MLQQVMTEPGVIAFQEVETPKAGAGQALVRIEKIGICGSDIHVYHGEHPFTRYPVTQGHEVSGVVEALGEGVEGLRPGAEGDDSAAGRLRQVLSLPPRQVQPVRGTQGHGLSDDGRGLALLRGGGRKGDAAAGRHVAGRRRDDRAARRRGARGAPGGRHAGLKIVVLGAGPIGNLVAQTAKGMGAADVMITDVSDWRLQKAADCGVQHCVNTKKEDLGEAILAAFGPDKADVIYDCAGNNVTMGQAIRYARKGSTIILVAVFAGMAQVDLAVLNDHELDLNTTMMYRSEDYLKAIELVNEGKVRLAPLVSRHFAFRDYLEAYRYIDENRETTMKVIIDVQK